MRKIYKNLDDKNIQKTIKKSLDFETTLVDIRKKSEKRAWLVAGVSTFISICLVGGLFYVLPLKEKEPYLVMADVYTGQATVAKLEGDWNSISITKNDAINKSNISHFITARESFDSQIIYDNDWATVYSMSVAGVSDTYRNLMHKSNPNSPFNLYGSSQSMRVKILSIVLNNSGKVDGRDASATVRFQRFLLNKSTGASRFIDSNVATLTYTYNSNLKMDEKYRIKNPLGFQVLSYRVDPDASSIPGQLPLDYPPAESVSTLQSKNEAASRTSSQAMSSASSEEITPIPISGETK